MNPHQKAAKKYVVLCKWRPSASTDESWTHFSVSVTDIADPQEAADNAALFLIWNHQGEAEALWVTDQHGNEFNPDSGIFDADAYDDYVTFAGKMAFV